MRRILCFLFACTALLAQETVKIGVDIALTNDGSTTNPTDLRDALIVCQEDLNSRPNAPYRYQLVIEDNEGTAKGSVLAVQKLIHVDKVDGLITIFDYAIAPVVPMAKRMRIPSLGVGWGTRYADGEMNFLFGYSEITEAERLSDYLESAGLKNVAVLLARAPANTAMAETFTERFSLRKGAKVDFFWFNNGEEDFRTIFLKMRETHPDALVILAYDADFARVMFQLHQVSDFSPKLVGTGFSFEPFQEKKLLYGAVYASTGGFPASLTEKFSKRFSHKLTHEYTPFAYDALGLIAYGLEHLPASDQQLPLRLRLQKALKATHTFEGQTGGYIQTGGRFDATCLKLYRMTPKGSEMIK